MAARIAPQPQDSHVSGSPSQSSQIIKGYAESFEGVPASLLIRSHSPAGTLRSPSLTPLARRATSGSLPAQTDAVGRLIAPPTPSPFDERPDTAPTSGSFWGRSSQPQHVAAVIESSQSPSPAISRSASIQLPSADVDTSGRHVFIFVNPASGGNGAASFTDAGLEYMRLSFPEPLSLWIWDIRAGKSGAKGGFLRLRSIIEDLKARNVDDLVYVIVGGGDGTVMWCITELWTHSIDDSRVVLGVVPYGTGNDFARALGWQKYNATRPFEGNFRLLKQLIAEWLKSRIVWHDIWEVELDLHPAGSFQKIDSSTRLKRMVTLVKKRSRGLSESGTSDIAPKSLTLKMCNYFSMGIESRIGIGFDRYRTRNQFCNKLRYGLEGVKKLIFKKTPKIQDFVSNMTQHEISGDDRLLFSTDKTGPICLNSAASIIASNIPSFAAGLDIWTASKKLGVAAAKPSSKASPSPQSAINRDINVVLKEEQRIGDGQLEFITFAGPATMGMERAIKGHGKRVCRGTGPFTMHFKEIQPDQRVYFQVDGEFFIMTCPKRLTIKWLRRLKVLANAEVGLDHLVPAT